MHIRAAPSNPKTRLRVKILPNRQKPWAIELAKKVRMFVQRHGFRLVAKNADATICIGGDGTIYYNNHQHQLEGKIIGIGSETSFVCQATQKNWQTKLPVLLRAKGEARSTLNAQAKGRRYNALGDVVIHTHDYRVIRVFVKIRNRVHVFEGDGIIIATPTGSTGYAYSAGGPKIATHRKTVLVVPICPYQRAFKPLLLKLPLDRISVWSDRTSDWIIDGILIGRLRKGERVRVHAGKPKVFA